MAKNLDKLLELTSDEIYRNYLWENNKREWFSLTLHNILKHFRPVLFFLIIFSFTFTGISNLADGTNRKDYLLMQIGIIQQTLPKLEKAYTEIDKLSNSISKVAYKDLDEAFIFAFFIYKWSKANGLDPMEVAGIIMTESEFNPNARSKADARGLMQIHKPSWKMADYFDAEENIKKGAQILLMYKKSYPKTYLDKYSGGAENYESKVKNNSQKIKKAAKPTSAQKEENKWIYQKIS